MKVLEKVQFNDKVALVLDKKPGQFLYSFIPGYGKKYIIGHDKTKTFYDCYYYDRPSK
jgi:hypothetical protein